MFIYEIEDMKGASFEEEAERSVTEEPLDEPGELVCFTEITQKPFILFGGL